MKFSYRLYPSLELLHELVQSFDRDETHQFKLEARSKSGNAEDLAYVKFFDVLARFPFCDEAAIKKALAKEAESVLGRFTDAKSYLYHRLLNALRKVHGNLTTDVSDIAAQMQVLIHKGLYMHVHELYHKGSEFATATEDFAGQLGLIELWKAALLHNLESSNRVDELQKLRTLEKTIKQGLSNLQEWQELVDLLAIVFRSSGEARAGLLAHIHQHPLFVNDGPCLSVKAEIQRLSLREKLLGVERMEHEGRLSILIEIASLIESHTPLLENVLIVERYLYATYNFGLLGIVLGNRKAFDSAIHRLTNLISIKKDVESLVFERVAKLHLVADLAEIDFPNAALSVSKALTGIRKYGKRLSPKHHVELILHIALFYFQMGQWSEIGKLLSKYLNESPIFNDPRAIALLWIFYIIAQHEQGNMETMKTYSEYGQKYLRKHGLDSEIASSILVGLRRISSKNDETKKRSEFNRFEKEVLPLLAKGANLYYAKMLPFETWVEYNLKGKKLSTEAFRKKSD